MEFKGTKGSWKYRDGYRNDIVTDDDKCFGICDLGTEREAFLADYPLEELQANAKLIASAPDLLEALQGFVNLKDLILPDSDVSIEYEGEAQAVFSVIQKAQKAIEKALK